MKKSTLISLLLAAPIIVFSLLAQNKSEIKQPIYLHAQEKTTRSSQEHLSTFSDVGNVILDFYADWCNPCKRMSPLIDELAATMSHYTFIKINRDYFLDLAHEFNIQSIPTLIFLRNGKEIGRYNGKPLTRNELEKLIHTIYSKN